VASLVSVGVAYTFWKESSVYVQYTRVTDTHTDGRTDRRTEKYPNMDRLLRIACYEADCDHWRHVGPSPILIQEGHGMRHGACSRRNHREIST